MKILITGAGGFIGSHLQKTRFDISYIARGTRFEFLKKNGLKLKSQLGDKSIKKIKIFNTIPNKIDFDVIISTVKLYDFDGFIEEIKKRSPIWKKEHYENENSEWLKGISLNN